MHTDEQLELNRPSKQKKTLMQRVMVYASVALVAQILILTAVLLGLGVSRSMRTNEINKLRTVVDNRATLLQKTLHYCALHANSASDKLTEVLKEASTLENQQAQVMPVLLDLIEEMSTTGTFVVFGDLSDATNDCEILYLRDTQPDVVYYDHSDILFHRGESAIAKQYKIPVDSTWWPYIQMARKHRFLHKTACRSGSSAVFGIEKLWLLERPFFSFKQRRRHHDLYAPTR